ncbi:MAG: 5-formyltetrahydrofolate cyclo-ligase [Patescibacteria group bacterium]
MTTVEQKHALRQCISMELSRLDARRKDEESTAVCGHILPSFPPESAGICAYVPLPDEVDLRSAMEEILRRGIPLFLPRFDNHEVTFHRVDSFESLQTGTGGILEPPPDAPQPDPQKITVVLVPGRAFDRQGNRLGRGKAGYDRWIAEHRKANPSTRFWGIAFAEQLVDRVPVDGHDERMDTVVTPEGMLDVEESVR